MNIEYSVKEEITDFGKVWYFTDEENISRFALYMYNDEPRNFYLSNIYVDIKYRQTGRGNYILEKATEIAKEHNAENIMLKVLDLSIPMDFYIALKIPKHRYHSIPREEKRLIRLPLLDSG